MSIQAYAIDSFNIWVPCTCKQGYHIHGSSHDYETNRKEDRVHHCVFKGCTPYNEIVINDKTLRTTVKRRNKTGERKWFTCNKQFEFRKRKLKRQIIRGCKSSTK